MIEIEEMLSNADPDYLQEGYTVQRTGKAAAIRLIVPVVDFHEEFDEHLEEIQTCFNEMQKMNLLVKQLDTNLTKNILIHNRMRQNYDI